MTRMLQDKAIHAHPDKSGLLLLGSVVFKDKIKKNIKESPIFLDKFSLQIKLSDKYLGQTFQSDLATSALATVKDRQGMLKEATIEIRR